MFIIIVFVTFDVRTENPQRKPPRRKLPKKKVNLKSFIPTFILWIILFTFALEGRGKECYAMVSGDKWPIVSKYSWYLGKAGYPICYDLGKMSLHKLVYRLTTGTPCPQGLFIDHIDRNKLNNSDSNLRLATPQQNSFNKTSSTNLKGVRKISEGNYTASITRDGKKHEIKNIPSASQAAETYNYMAEELFGVFASYNNVDNIKEV